MCSHPQTTSLSHVDEVCQPLWGRPKPPVSPAMDAGGTSPPWDPGKLMCSELWSFAFEDGSLGDWREEWSGHRVAGTGPIRAPQEHSLRLGEGLQAERGGRASHRGQLTECLGRASSIQGQGEGVCPRGAEESGDPGRSGAPRGQGSYGEAGGGGIVIATLQIKDFLGLHIAKIGRASCRERVSSPV